MSTGKDIHAECNTIKSGPIHSYLVVCLWGRGSTNYLQCGITSWGHRSVISILIVDELNLILTMKILCSRFLKLCVIQSANHTQLYLGMFSIKIWANPKMSKTYNFCNETEISWYYWRTRWWGSRWWLREGQVFYFGPTVMVIT